MEDWGKATASRQRRHKLGWFEEPDMQRNDRGVTYYILITTSSQPQNLVTTTLQSCHNVTTTPSQSITTLWSCPHNVVIILVCVITTLWLLLCAHLVLPLIRPSGAWLMPIKWINCGWQFAKMLGRTEQRQGVLGRHVAGNGTVRPNREWQCKRRKPSPRYLAQKTKTSKTTLKVTVWQCCATVVTTL